MSERIKSKTIIVLSLLLALVAYIVITLTTPAAANERSLSSAICSQPAGKIVSLNSLTDFSWEKVYTFAPYTTKKEIFEILGFKSKIDLETVSESMVQMIFTEEEEVVCVLLGYPDKLGYAFDYGQEGYDYLVFPSAEEPNFRIERPYSRQLLLRYLPDM